VPDQRAERRLAAILAADVAGYSRLMGADEEGTHAALKGVFASLLNPRIEKHRGRVAKTMGDGVLAEFASAVDAMRCAVDIQRGAAEHNAGLPDERQIRFRIGVNIGDIIFDGGDIFGDGVNIAARIETIADPGTICLSESTYQQVAGKIGVEATDLGEQRLKNIDRPIRIYRVQLNGAAVKALPLPDKPSIAVLPFANMSGDTQQDYFAEGMAEEIITALSRCHSLFVIARNSSFVYKGKSVDIRQVGRALGVRYVLEGSVRRSGDKLRITGQLIDAASGAHIWADRFEGASGDVFALQDRFSESVVATIEPRLQLAEIARLKQKPAGDLNAYDLLLRAQQAIYDWTAESFESALLSLKQALAIDPDYAPAMAALANLYCHRRSQGWAKDPAGEAADALRLATRAIELGRDDGEVLWRAANVVWQMVMDANRAAELAHLALDVNPNSSIALTIAGWIEASRGDPDKALELFERAQRLSPRDPRGWVVTGGVGYCHYQRREYKEAVAWTQKALVENPRSAPALWFLAAAWGQLGDKEKAAAAMAEVLKLEPTLTLSRLRARSMYTREDIWLHTCEGLRLAGMPA
jgi:adenylate cyclase